MFLNLKSSYVNTKFIFYYLKNNQNMINKKIFQGAGLKNPNKKSFAKLKIPIPPLEIQKK